MTSALGLLHSALDDPEDNVPRLILADWCEDDGSSVLATRGELIRVQCELANWVPDRIQRQALLERETQLIENHAFDWLGGLYKHSSYSRFERGLAQLTVRCKQFLSKRFTPEVLRNAWVESVCLEDIESTAASLARSINLEGVPALEINGSHRDWEAAAIRENDLCLLLRSPHLSNLRRLSLTNNELTDSAADALAQSPVLANLTHLNLRNNNIQRRGLQALLESPNLPRLRWLGLHGNALDRNDLRDLFMPWREKRNSMLPPGLLINSLAQELVHIPAGTFLMGAPANERGRKPSEGPVHEVEITRPFYLGVYLVTQGEYLTVMGHNPALHFRRSLHHPVEEVSWNQAVTFCERLNALPEEKKAGRTYRLPTEAEWEYACRAGTSSVFACGSTLTQRDADFTGGGAATCRVGSFPPNGFGLYDMHGNVWEWCSDFFHHRAYETNSRKDPRGPESGTERVVRGGGWSSTVQECRSASRQGWGLDFTSCSVGFRVVCEISRPTEGALT